MIHRGNSTIKAKLTILLITICFIVFCYVEPVESYGDQISVLIPAFNSQDDIGVNAATTLNLQIWKTLRRKAPPYDKNSIDFGKGKIIWNDKPLKDQNHEEAERMAKDIHVLAQIVLWGEVYWYGDGVVVQTSLSIPEYNDCRKKKLEIWEIQLNSETIKVDIPRRRFEMSSIILKKSLIEKYSLPSALKMYSDSTLKTETGIVGVSYTAKEFKNEVALVESNGKTGWVPLPSLSDEPNEVSDFVAGLVRIFRGDWQGAIDMFDSVINNTSTRTPRQIDAYLYRGMAKEQLGDSGKSDFQKAYELNPYSKTTVQYQIMGNLSTLSRLKKQHNTAHKQTEIVDKIKQLISANGYLFPKDDDWLKQVKNLI